MNTVELKRKVAALEAKLQESEEENTLLRNLNEMFGDENDKLSNENETLKKEAAKFQQFRMPSSTLTRPENIVSRKRSKSCPEPEGTDEQNAVKARVNFLSMAEFLLTSTERTLTFVYLLFRSK
jgi:predicted nuclease with TOPRIM domain